MTDTTQILQDLEAQAARVLAVYQEALDGGDDEGAKIAALNYAGISLGIEAIRSSAE